MSIGFKIYLVLEILTIILQGKLAHYQCQHATHICPLYNPLCQIYRSGVNPSYKTQTNKFAT